MFDQVSATNAYLFKYSLFDTSQMCRYKEDRRDQTIGMGQMLIER